MMAKILLSGSNGFAAHYVAQSLSKAGNVVVGLTRCNSGQNNPWVSETHYADLTDVAETRALLERVRPDQVIHLAATSFVAHNDIAELYANNVVGTRNLLDALADLGNLNGPSLIVSSANVYGAAASGQVDENIQPMPSNDYGISKLAVEHLARIYQPKVPSIILRPFNYTGRGQSNQFIIPKIIEHLKNRQSTIELGNLLVARDFSDVRFFAEACRRFLDCPAAIGQSVNICSGNAYSLEDILDLAQNLSGFSLDVRVNQNFIRSNEVRQLWGDPRKMQGLIGSINAPTLSETISWMLSDKHEDKLY
jgi:nucleoside-diphosphate-sugar epimerase